MPKSADKTVKIFTSGKLNLFFYIHLERRLAELSLSVKSSAIVFIYIFKI